MNIQNHGLCYIEVKQVVFLNVDFLILNYA